MAATPSPRENLDKMLADVMRRAELRDASCCRESEAQPAIAELQVALEIERERTSQLRVMLEIERERTKQQTR